MQLQQQNKCHELRQTGKPCGCKNRVVVINEGNRLAMKLHRQSLHMPGTTHGSVCFAEELRQIDMPQV